jgi:hypothetical protein
VLLGFQPMLSAPNVPDRARSIIVARVWPPRKRDFPLFQVDRAPASFSKPFALRWRNA